MSVPTKQLLKVHRYAGLITAPLILFFAISGIWQVYRFQDDPKNGPKAPAALKAGSRFHMVEELRPGFPATAFKATITAAAIVLAFAAGIGIVLGFRTTRPQWMAMLLLAGGIAVPLVLYMLAMSGAP